MIYNKDNLFIHIPKTGGTSFRHLVNEKLDLEKNPLEKAPYKHYTLQQAYDNRYQLGINFNELKNVIVFVRNPYAKMLSLYSFYKQIYIDKGLRKNNPNIFKLMHLDFNQWLVEIEKQPVYYAWFSYERYILLNGVKPDNLVLLRHEKYRTEVEKAMRLFKVKKDEGAKLPTIFKTTHKHFTKVYNRTGYDVVNGLFKWVFDQEMYNKK